MTWKLWFKNLVIVNKGMYRNCEAQYRHGCLLYKLHLWALCILCVYLYLIKSDPQPHPFQLRSVKDLTVHLVFPCACPWLWGISYCLFHHHHCISVFLFANPSDFICSASFWPSPSPAQEFCFLRMECIFYQERFFFFLRTSILICAQSMWACTRGVGGRGNVCSCRDLLCLRIDILLWW